MKLKQRLKKKSQEREEDSLYKEQPYKYTEVIVGFLTKKIALSEAKFGIMIIRWGWGEKVTVRELEKKTHFQILPANIC